METLFSKPLEVNDKIGSSAPVNDPELLLLESRTQRKQHAEEQLPRRKGLVINKLTSGDPSISLKRETRSRSGIASATRKEHIIAPSRPVRSTRATRPVLDTYSEEIVAVKETPKFSVEFGLGKPWDR